MDADGSANLAPMSSLWWLGRSCMLGFGARSETPINIQRTGECVINLPSVREVGAVNRLAKTSASDPLPPHKMAMGYRTERDKFGVAGITPVASDLVSAPRAGECPVQMEAFLEAVHPLAVRDPLRRGALVALELRVARVHVDEGIRMAGHDHRIDPDRWRPLVMSFQQFYGLGEQVHPSTLATIEESSYRRGPVPAAPVPSRCEVARAVIA
jgi:flavin reductase (DIM6/NTAB) family NADH-FMN oxidoreductase RutF